MPDLSIIYKKVCMSNDYWQTSVTGSKGDIYDIQFDSRLGWNCSCPAFKYGKGACKHIKMVENKKCNWNIDAYCGSGEEIEGFICPKCGGELKVIKVGV